jgi:hypothetical protein
MFYFSSICRGRKIITGLMFFFLSPVVYCKEKAFHVFSTKFFSLSGFIAKEKKFYKCFGAFIQSLDSVKRRKRVEQTHYVN